MCHQFQLLVTVDDRSRFKEYRGHARFPQHDQLIVLINAGLGIKQLVATPAHQRQRVMGRVLLARALELFAQKMTELEAALWVAIFVRDKNRVALKAGPELVLMSSVFPFFEQVVRH